VTTRHIGDAMSMLDAGGDVASERRFRRFERQAANMGMAGAQFDRFVARRLARDNARRQINSLVLQQAFVGAASAPGEEEQFGAAASRTADREARDFQRFKDRFGPRFAEMAHRESTRRSLAAGAAELERRKKAERDRAYWSGRSGSPFWARAEKPTFVGPPRPQPTGEDLRRAFMGTSGGFPAFAAGGLVGGNGTTDSLLARLTPGEFVMSRQATRDIGANNLAKANAGGSGGGSLGLPPEVQQAMAAYNQTSAKLAEGMTAFAGPAQALASSLTLFGASVDKLVGAMEKFPTSVEHSHRVTAEVVINGAEAFAGMEDRWKGMMAEYVTGAVHKALEDRMPEAPGRLRSDPTRV
jgi:hypothetical protein